MSRRQSLPVYLAVFISLKTRTHRGLMVQAFRCLQHNFRFYPVVAVRASDVQYNPPKSRSTMPLPPRPPAYEFWCTRHEVDEIRCATGV